MKTLARIAFAALSLTASPVLAGNDDELPVGNRAAMVGGAVVSTVEDASAAWYNAAGLASIETHSVEVSGSAYSLRMYSADDFIRSSTSASRDETFTEFVTVPTQVAFSMRLTDDVNLGLGFFAPRATDFILRTRLDDGDDDWSVAVSFEAMRYAGGAAVGAEISPTLRLGAGLFGQYDSFSEAGSVFGVAHEMGIAQRVAQIGFVATSSRVSLEAVAGMQWDVAPWLVLGVAVRSPQATVTAEATSTQQLSFTDLSGPTTDAGSDEIDLDIGGREIISLGRYTLGVAWRPRWGSVSVEADVQPAFENADADVDRATLVNARLGVLGRLSDTTRIGWGLFTDRTPSRLSETGLVGLVADFYGTTAGIEFGDRHALAEDAERDSIRFATTFALRYAFGAADTKAIVVNRDADPSDMFTSESEDMRIHEFGFYLGSGLYF